MQHKELKSNTSEPFNLTTQVHKCSPKALLNPLPEINDSLRTSL